MAIPYLCYDGDAENNVAPHRPSVDDLGSDSYEDFPGEPVDTTHEWPADCANQMCQVVERLGRLSDNLKISVRFADGAPFVQSSVQPRTSAVTITATDDGTGITALTWPANSFPPNLVDATATINVVSGSAAGYATTETIANGVRVRCYDTAGALANLPFTVRVG